MEKINELKKEIDEVNEMLKQNLTEKVRLNAELLKLQEKDGEG